MATWTIDVSHSSVHFSVRHMVFAKTRGQFTAWTATLEAGSDLSNAKLSASIDAASINTGDPQRDGHLKAPDFLDAEKHTKITFDSTRVEQSGANYTVHGNLSIRGVTKEVALAVEETGRGKDPWGNQRVGFSAKTKIDRKDFGLVWNQVLEAGGVLVGETIEIEIEIEAIAA
jgi:polyisoprenoid-binding protein YceI